MSKDEKSSHHVDVKCCEVAHELEVHQHELLMQNEELRKSELNLEEARDRYFDLFDLAPVAYLTVDVSGEIIEANFATALLFGCGRAELLGQRLSRFVVPEQAGRFQQFRAKLHDTGAREACELRCRRPPSASSTSNTAFPVRMQGVAPSGRDGEAGHRASIAIVDLSEIARAEQELKRSNDRLASFMDATSDCVLVLSDAGIITEVNPPTLALLGFTEGEILGRHIRSLDHGMSPSLGGAVASSEVLWHDSAGGLHLMWLSISPIESASASAEYLCTAQDVTAQRSAQEKLRLSEQLLRQIAETIEDGFYLREHASGEFSYLSPAFESIFGHLRQDFDAQANLMTALVHEEDLEHLMASRALFLRGDPFDEEYRIVRPDGDVRWIRERAFLVGGGAHGEVERTAGIVQDITDQRQMDIEIRQGQKMEAIGQLASGVAHDFNNILMGIHGCASIGLSRLEEASEVRPFLEAIRQSSESGTAIIKQLLAFSSNRNLEIATFDLRDLVAGDETMLTRLLGDNVQLEISQCERVCPVRLGSGQVEQVLMNLAINARDAMPDGGTLTIETDRSQDTLPDGRVRIGPSAILRVSDTGTGMSDEVRERIFEPFFTTKGIGEGTGLGLSTVYGIVNDAGGSLRCKSVLGEGTTFTVRLPLAEESKTSNPGTADPPSFDGALAEGRSRVLLVEDESIVRMATRLYLESAGFEVVESGNGRDAAELFEAEGSSIDLLVSDIGLPGLGGPALATRARAVKPDLPVVFMSAHPEDWLLEKRRLRRGEFTLQKPFSREALLQKVRDALELRSDSQ